MFEEERMDTVKSPCNDNFWQGIHIIWKFVVKGEYLKASKDILPKVKFNII